MSTPTASEFMRPADDRPAGNGPQPGDDNSASADAGFSLDRMTAPLRDVQAYVREQYKYHDRGTGRNEIRRNQANQPFLVATGSHAGRSQVRYVGFDWKKWTMHLWRKDFFTSIANIHFAKLCLYMLIAYSLTYLFWAIVWYVTWSISPECVEGATNNFFGFYLFSVETQATIGYGVRSAGVCFWSSVFLTLQNVCGMILDAVCLGIIFAKISHPKHRGRSVCISDCSVISRQDGVLKLMFRIADIRSSTACDAKLRAYIYTWGEGRRTMEGEYLPVRVEPLELGAVDGMLLLPQTIEHVIDERSPMHGIDHTLLESNNCELVVTFEAVSEFGDTFMVRQSYLAPEIYWGHMFTPIVEKASPGYTRHCVDLSRFHDVEPQPSMEVTDPAAMSRAVLSASGLAKMLPYPQIGTNTLVVSRCCTVAQRDGAPCLQFRIGDTRPGQMLEVHVRAYVYDWSPAQQADGSVEPFTMQELDLGYDHGQDRLMLRYPQTVSVPLANSPLAPYARAGADPEGAAPIELLVVVEGVMYSNAANMMRSVTFRVPDDLRHGHTFVPLVSAPPRGGAPDDAVVDWAAFHSTRDSAASAAAKRAGSYRAGLTGSSMAQVLVAGSPVSEGRSGGLPAAAQAQEPAAGYSEVEL